MAWSLPVRCLAGLAFAFSTFPVLAETDAQWKPGKANKASTCKVTWGGVGLPRHPSSPVRDVTLVCRMRFVLSHNNTARTADWVIERLKKAQVSGTIDRPEGKAFVQERFVPPRGRAKNGDYTNTRAKFDRGHLAAAEDFNQKLKWMDESFVYSNAVPQVGDRFNGAIWRLFEHEVRQAAKARDEIYVITGPVRSDGRSRTRTIARANNACGNAIDLTGPAEEVVCDANNKNSRVKCTRGVTVPIALYKIIFDPKAGVAYAFILPNRDHPSKTGTEVRPYLDSFRTTVAVVEDLTGLTFFSDTPANVRSGLVQQCAAQSMWAP